MGRKPKQCEAKVDFNAAALLDSHLHSAMRRPVRGITIDKPDARILDDGFFIAKKDDGWVVDVSIADVPSMIPEHHDLEYAARKMGYERSARERLFPYGYLLNYVSLQHGQKRPAITFTIALDRDLNITSYGAERTIFENLKQCNDNDIAEQLARQNPEVEMWVDLGRRLYQKRMEETGLACDRMIANDNAAPLPTIPVAIRSRHEGEALVHEMMRLANLVATRFLHDHNLDAPFKSAAGVVDIIRVSRDFNFDLQCNRLAQDAVAALAKDTPSYAHISSPMREYKDFLGLKIIARHLDGMPAEEGDRKLSQRLSEEFNARAVAAVQRNDICTPEWQETWARCRSTQDITTHQRIEQDPTTPIGSLRQYCKDQGWRMPKLAERRLLINGAQVTLAGLRCGQAGGATGWSVHHDADSALNLAALRVKREMGLTV